MHKNSNRQIKLPVKQTSAVVVEPSILLLTMGHRWKHPSGIEYLSVLIRFGQ